MKLKRDDLYNAITDIDDRFIEEADGFAFKKKFNIVKLSSTLGAVAAVLIVGFVGYNTFFNTPKYSTANDTGFKTTMMAVESTNGAALDKLLDAEEVAAASENSETSINFVTGSKTEEPDVVKDSAPVDFTENLLSNVFTCESNTVVSPMNVYLAMGMLAEVTDNESRSQILSVLGHGSMDELRDSAVDLYATNNFEDERVTSNLAAALWLSDRYNYKESSLKNLSDFFFADSFSGTMGAPGYNEQLHDWLNNNTGNLLKNQVSGINFTEDTNAAITTTVYFKSSWQDEFSKGATRKDTFRAPDGNQTVDFMHKNERGRYYVSDNYTAAAVYMQEGYSMLFLLPDEGLTPNDLIKDASAMRFILSGDNAPESSICRINYSVPKFDVDSQLNLTGILASMGVTDVMDCHTSDFSNLTADTDEIYVKDIIHGARVKIDEEGCEAAAYTVIMMDNATAIREEPIVDFVVDRPFVFVIRNPEGKPLFVGTVYNIE